MTAGKQSRLHFEKKEEVASAASFNETRPRDTRFPITAKAVQRLTCPQESELWALRSREHPRCVRHHLVCLARADDGDSMRSRQLAYQLSSSVAQNSDLRPQASWCLQFSQNTPIPAAPASEPTSSKISSQARSSSGVSLSPSVV